MWLDRGVPDPRVCKPREGNPYWIMAMKRGGRVKAGRSSGYFLYITDLGTLHGELRPDRNHSYRWVTSAAAGAGKAATVAVLLAPGALLTPEGGETKASSCCTPPDI